MNAIKVKGVSVTGRIHDIELDLPKGAVMGLIGENGAGKSTLIKAITGIVKPQSGYVELLGEKNAAMSAKMNEVGVVLDNECFPKYLNAVKISKVMSGIYANWDEEVFFKYVDKFGIDRKRKFREYSKGMKMKLSIAAALSHGAKLLILDEATSGLDPVVRDEILDIIDEFTRDEEHSVLMSSHILSDIERCCDYICYISDGNVVFCEDAEELSESFVIVHYESADEIDVPKEYIIGRKSGRYGVSVLVKRENAPQSGDIERASIEDIMVYRNSKSR